MTASKFARYQPKILVIDDTPANVKLLTQMLSHHGYDVRVALNGTMGLRSALADPPDLILLDIQMPQMDGYEVCKQLNAEVRTREIPTLFLSALDDVADKVKAFEVGGADYVTKPFETVEVLARVENHLKLRSLQQASRRSEQESRVLFEASKQLNDAPDLHSAIQLILKGLCQLVYWDYAEVWMPEEGGKGLRLSSNCACLQEESFLEFQAQRQELRILPGEGLPGRIWAMREPEWMESGLEAEIGTEVGLKVGFGVPVLVEERTLAVLIFYLSSQSAYPEQALGIVSTVTAQLTAFVGRKQAEVALQRQQARTEEILFNILPHSIAQRLLCGETAIADSFEDASVLFADLVGFTEFASERPPQVVVAVLDDIFSEFDALTEHYGLEKIKTIGDNYMVVGGLPLPKADHLGTIARFSLELLAFIRRYNQQQAHNFQLRVGINSGPVVAGAIGKSKSIYDLWGDTVNVASRMESTGEEGKIQVTAAVRDRLAEHFQFEERGEILVKGKGHLRTYWLLKDAPC